MFVFFWLLGKLVNKIINKVAVRSDAIDDMLANLVSFHQALGEGSRTLMDRIADLLRHIEFVGQHPDNPVMQALAFYQQKGGHISSLGKADELPTDFLSREERKAVLGEEVDFALYRTLLARSVLDDLKGGRITVATSHTYQAFEDYLIDEITWQAQKQTLLERAGLRHLESWSTVKEDLEKALQAQMGQTIDAISAGGTCSCAHVRRVDCVL
ncbi:hypothetical protein GCM10027423_25990 [Spirosoma arcticum]